MTSAITMNAETGRAYLAAARHFQKLAKLFASPMAVGASGLTSKQLRASSKLFQKALPDELAEVSALLNLIIAEIERIEPRVESNAGLKGSERP